jgi:hypothetical protein
MGARAVPPGSYRVVLTVDGQDYTQSFRIEADPSGPAQILAEPDGDDEERKEDR